MVKRTALALLLAASLLAGGPADAAIGKLDKIVAPLFGTER